MKEDVILTHLKKINRTLKESYKESSKSYWDLNICDIYYEESCRNKEPYIFPIITLRTNSCWWYRTAGGCSMCNYQEYSALDRKITDKNLIAQFEWALDRLKPVHKYPDIHITSSGSFMDPKEISDNVLN